MTSVTCGLTAEDRNKLWNHAIISSMGLHVPLPQQLFEPSVHTNKRTISVVELAMPCQHRVSLICHLLQLEETLTDVDNFSTLYAEGSIFHGGS